MVRNPTVCVALRLGRMFVIPQWSPGPGTYIDTSPIAEVNPTSCSAIGDAVFTAMANFKWDNSCQLPDWNTYPKHVLDVGGFKNWSEYRRGLVDCVVEQEADQYRILTYHPHIFLPLDIGPRELGEVVLQALGTSVEKERTRAGKRGRRTL
jgi:hypothetical protein